MICSCGLGFYVLTLYVFQLFIKIVIFSPRTWIKPLQPESLEWVCCPPWTVWRIMHACDFMGHGGQIISCSFAWRFVKITFNLLMMSRHKSNCHRACSVPDCGVVRFKCPALSLHTFPQNEQLRKLDYKNLQRRTVKGKLKQTLLLLFKFNCIIISYLRCGFIII